MYGLDDDKCKHVAAQCLTACRMVERGVRFIQIYSGGMETSGADGRQRHRRQPLAVRGETDKPIAALLQDLSQRGLLDETLVVWGGEFGRLPVARNPRNPGATITRTRSPTGWPAAA